MKQDPNLITDGTKLFGEAMPRMLAAFRLAVIGRRIIDAGYYRMLDGEVRPCLVLDNGDAILAQSDDEGNGPGVLTTSDCIVSQTWEKRT